ncbi:MAG: ATP-binding cassette domain-containing protein [Bacteroidota bacterium]
MDILIKDLGKRYNREWVFKSLDFEFKSGSRVAIVGHNGSGKSTLLKIICNYLTPSEGTIEYKENGSRLEKDSVQLRFGLVAPYVNIIGEFTVSEMLDFHKKFKRTDFTNEEILESAKLQDASNKAVQDLSSGMLQRLKLSLIFFFDNDVIFLDEPTTNLDSQSIEWYSAQIDRLKKTQTIIVASNQEKEYHFCDQWINIEEFKS